MIYIHTTNGIIESILSSDNEHVKITAEDGSSLYLVENANGLKIGDAFPPTAAPESTPEHVAPLFASEAEARAHLLAENPNLVFTEIQTAQTEA